MRPVTAVFDLDGTIVDTAADLARATNHALASVDLRPVPLPQLRSYVSNGARVMIERALQHLGARKSVEEVDVMLETFLAYYHDHIAIDSVPYPDVIPVLQRLRENEARLAVCTNKREGLARLLLKSLGMDRLFHVIVGRDTLPVCKPDPGHLIGSVILADGDLGRCVMVGDSEIDVRTAKAASIPVIAVDFGYSKGPIAESEPDLVISHYRDLEAGIAKVLPLRSRERRSS